MIMVNNGHTINKKWFLKYGEEHGLVPPPSNDSDDEGDVVAAPVL